MAKILSPSGETEFFQTTELQQAFEKELKTGERVTIAPGVREASFLREAPVRAEYTEAFQEFKDRILNPYIPITIPVDRFKCASVLRPMKLEVFPSYVDPNGATDIEAPYLDFTTVLDTSFGSFAVPEINTDLASIFNGTEWNFILLPYSNIKNRTKPVSTQITVPNYYTLTGYVFDYLWSDPTLPVVNMGGIDITVGAGGGVPFSTGAFVCNNIPNTSYPPIPIFEIKADLFVPAYSNTPYPYDLDFCSYTLCNYSFTNFFP